MRQQRITDLFPKVSGGAAHAVTPRASGFMKLPPGIRQTIYGLAGLEQDTKEKFIDLNMWNYREPTTTPFEDGCSADAELSRLSRLHVNWKSRIPVNLFHVSRAIHDEVEEVFYRSHIWGVSASGAGGLDVLEGLSRKAVTAMRFLLISLTPCGCRGCVPTGGACIHPIPVDARLELDIYRTQHSGIVERGYSSLSQEDAEAHGNSNKRPLDVCSSLDRRTVAQWDRICEKLAQHAEPRRFSLYVHCVVKDYKTAERIAKPLRRLQLLGDLAISFGQRNNNSSPPAPHDEQLLLELAKATAQATKYRFSFPFMDLPTELQLHILEFTNLVVSDGFECMWIGGRLALSRRNKNGSNEEMIETSRADGYYAWLLAEAFCAKRNLAFRDRCRCNKFPVSYLLVSRRFRNLALEVFYRRNQFVASYNNFGWCNTVTTTHGWNAPPLTHVLEHITRLILIAPIRRNVMATIGFTRLVELLRAHACLPSLTLELHVRDVHPRHDVVAALRRVPGIYGEARRRRRHTEIYSIIFRNIRKKLAAAGLKAFLLYLWWENYDPQVTGDDVEERRAMEREKEKEVMGEAYDSENWGKELQRKPFARRSIW